MTMHSTRLTLSDDDALEIITALHDRSVTLSACAGAKFQTRARTADLVEKARRARMLAQFIKTKCCVK